MLEAHCKGTGIRLFVNYTIIYNSHTCRIHSDLRIRLSRDQILVWVKHDAFFEILPVYFTTNTPSRAASLLSPIQTLNSPGS